MSEPTTRTNVGYVLVFEREGDEHPYEICHNSYAITNMVEREGDENPYEICHN